MSITAPAADSTVKGTVAVTASAAAVDGDTMASITFYDGVDQIGTGTCQSQPTCTASVSWKATGLSGQHSLTARARTSTSLTTTSAAVLVNVESPPPAVSITSPAADSTVAGAIVLSLSAATDPSQEDYPTNVSVFDGVNRIGGITCQSQQTCQGTVNWNATGLTGLHTLTATVRTNRSLSVTSAPTPVTIVSPAPNVTITNPPRGAALRRKITVKVSGRTHPSQVDYPTSITVYDGTSTIGSVNCQGQQTCAGSVPWDARSLSGRHSLTAVIRTNTSRTATSAAIVVGTRIKRAISPSCTLSRMSATLGQAVRGRCKMTGVPKGTRVAIQYRSGQTWKTAVSGRVGTGGRFNFTLRGTRRARFDLYVLVSGSSRTKSARARIGILRIS